MAIQWEKWSQKRMQLLKLNPRKRAECVLREARCAANPGAVRLALQQAVAAEIDRMRALQESEEAVRAFQAATEIHIALCSPDAAEGRSPAVAHGEPIAPYGDNLGPA
ncbi:MAG: hypothetical protein ACREYB_04015 [Casimicrobiaceae bacterium]